MKNGSTEKKTVPFKKSAVIIGVSVAAVIVAVFLVLISPLGDLEFLTEDGAAFDDTEKTEVSEENEGNEETEGNEGNEEKETGGEGGTFHGYTEYSTEKVQGDSEGESVTVVVPGVTLEEIFAVSGEFVEDGSFDHADKVAAVRLKNQSGRTLEALSFKIIMEGEEFSFSVSMFPSGKSLTVLELSKKPLPENVGKVECRVDYYLFCEKQNRMGDFSVEILDGAVKVTNLSGHDAENEITVYYKRTNGGSLYGGRTYRIRIKEGIGAGECVVATAAHAKKEKTETVFIEEIEGD